MGDRHMAAVSPTDQENTIYDLLFLFMFRFSFGSPISVIENASPVLKGGFSILVTGRRSLLNKV